MGFQNASSISQGVNDVQVRVECSSKRDTLCCTYRKYLDGGRGRNIEQFLGIIYGQSPYIRTQTRVSQVERKYHGYRSIQI